MAITLVFDSEYAASEVAFQLRLDYSGIGYEVLVPYSASELDLAAVVVTTRMTGGICKVVNLSESVEDFWDVEVKLNAAFTR